MIDQNNNTPRFSIIIPTATNYTGLVKCIESIVNFTDLSQCEVLVIANGAPVETRGELQHQGLPSRVLWFDEMIGFTRAVNEGLAVAKGEYIVLLNDDVELLPQPKNFWLDELHKPFADPKMGITGPLKNFCPAAQREFLLFFCVMIRKSTLDEIGILDMCFNPGGGEDTDLSCRAVDRGWKIQAVPDEPPQYADRGDPSLPAHQQGMYVTRFPLWHKGGVTVGSPAMFDHYQTVIARNSEILKRRYAVNIDRANTIEGWMAESELMWLGQQARTASIFIELGSWAGRSTRAIADNLPVGSILYACDSWNGSSGEPDAHKTAKEREGDGAFMRFFDNLYDHIVLGRVIPLRMESGNAAEALAKKGVKADICFIDADHSYEGVKRDIQLWQPLVKEGGILCGHDYNLPEQSWDWVGVRQCVDEMFPHAQQAPNTSIWYIRCTCPLDETEGHCELHGIGEPPSPWEVLKTYAPVSEPQKGYGGFFDV